MTIELFPEPRRCHDGQQPVSHLKLARYFKNGVCTDRDPLAYFSLEIAGCHAEAELLRDGSLKLPAGLQIPAALRQRAQHVARRLALAELATAWSKQRDVDANGRFLPEDSVR